MLPGVAQSKLARIAGGGGGAGAAAAAAVVALSPLRPAAPALLPSRAAVVAPVQAVGGASGCLRSGRGRWLRSGRNRRACHHRRWSGRDRSDGVGLRCRQDAGGRALRRQRNGGRSGRLCRCELWPGSILHIPGDTDRKRDHGGDAQIGSRVRAFGLRGGGRNGYGRGGERRRCCDRYARGRRLRAGNSRRRRRVRVRAWPHDLRRGLRHHHACRVVGTCCSGYRHRACDHRCEIGDVLRPQIFVHVQRRLDRRGKCRGDFALRRDRQRNQRIAAHAQRRGWRLVAGQALIGDRAQRIDVGPGALIAHAVILLERRVAFGHDGGDCLASRLDRLARRAEIDQHRRRPRRG